ncbi:MAG: acyl-CoA thioesterase [Sediminibacterium sp.]|nr:acyl-CoA thioesterase [Sediminibacterium sp.]
MTQLKKTLESKMKVRFHDCDPFNHLNNSRYIDYFMTARGDQLLEDYDFDIYSIAREQSVGWVSAQTQISYLSPAFLAEEVIIQTQLVSYSEKSLLFEAVMWKNDRTILKAVLWGKLVHVNLATQKSHTHSPELMQFFSGVVNPLSVNMSFDERVKDLRKGL